jgi:signal transduction histidine kinase
VPVLVVVLAVSVASAYLGFARDQMIAVSILLYTVAVAAPVTVAACMLILAEVGVAVAAPFPPHAGNLLPRLVLTALVQLAAWTVGLAVRTQRGYAAGLREQAERRVQAEADRSRRALAEERLRIARELHDVVAHSMGVIAVQAGVGGHLAGSRPEEASKALRVIEDSSRSALQELRRMLTVLRDDGTAAGGEAELLPAPGLANLPDLINRTAAAGLRVELSETGERGCLAEGIGVAAFRIVQEALANVIRHAHASHARVRLEHEPAGVRITVTDNGTGIAAPGAYAEGHGLQGMRERAALCGGYFSAGPCRGGGYEVRAFLAASTQPATS